MTKDEVLAVLKMPMKDNVILKLEQVNLTDKEKEILIMTVLRGMTELEAAEELDISRNCLQAHKKKALEKCAMAWE